ncbi:hypothetical protein B0H11DRAFT_2023739 [Mycena galericulata]|nr:hypothetical protein B0H11DRAFT_2023739 [Mycena galericulata]
MYSGYYTGGSYSAPAPGYYGGGFPGPLPMYGGGHYGGPAPGGYGGFGGYSYHQHPGWTPDLMCMEIEKEPKLLELLEDSHKRYNDVALSLTINWHHTDRKLEGIRYVYKIKPKQSSIFAYDEYLTRLDDDTVWMLWHGTSRNCTLGDDPTNLDPCDDSSCSLCQIIRGGFKNSKARASGMFGQGIYSTSISSKAAGYSTTNGRSPYRVLLWNEVALGKKYHATQPRRYATEPPPGYDSVHGKTGDSSTLKFEEYCVYDNNAIRPKYLVLYKEVAN